MKRIASLLTVFTALIFLSSCGGPGESADDRPDFFAAELGGSMKTVTETATSFGMGEGAGEVTQTISAGYALSQTEITNSQFAQFIDAGGYSDDLLWTTNGLAWRISGHITRPRYWVDPGEPEYQPDRPISGISWYEAVAFCNWLSLVDERRPAHQVTGEIDFSADGYRLPTEAEWEYAAAHAGGVSDRVYPYLDPEDIDNDGPFISTAQVWAENPYPGGTAPVGSCNGGETPLGLCDMAGNVKEWCADNYNIPVTPDSSYRFEDDSAPAVLITRGGGYPDYEGGLRAANRIYANVAIRVSYIGFRVLRPIH